MANWRLVSVNSDIIGSGPNLPSVGRKRITCIDVDLLSIIPLETNFHEIWIEI